MLQVQDGGVCYLLSWLLYFIFLFNSFVGYLLDRTFLLSCCQCLAGNLFSSLVGLQFVWQLAPKSLETDGVLHHLVHIPLKDTPLSDCGSLCGDITTQIKLENSVCLMLIMFNYQVALILF